MCQVWVKLCRMGSSSLPELRDGKEIHLLHLLLTSEENFLMRIVWTDIAKLLLQVRLTADGIR